MDESCNNSYLIRFYMSEPDQRRIKLGNYSRLSGHAYKLGLYLVYCLLIYGKICPFLFYVKQFFLLNLGYLYYCLKL